MGCHIKINVLRGIELSHSTIEKRPNQIKNIKARAEEVVDGLGDWRARGLCVGPSAQSMKRTTCSISYCPY